jgi:putative spermidine/putrescine transport system ATP-binding protein
VLREQIRSLQQRLGASGLAADLPPHRARPGSDVDVLVRPEGLRITASPTGNAIVVGRTFLGQLTRISVRLTGDVVVRVDQQSTGAAGITLGDPVDVSLAGAPVMVAER